MKKTRHSLQIASTFLVLAMVAGVCAADREPWSVVKVEGEAVIYQGDRPQAHRRALDEAFSAALTQVMGRWVSAESFTRNYQSIERGVYGKTQGYIKTYKVIGERVEGDALSLTVQVTVAVRDIKNDLEALGILLDAMNNPTLAVVGKEEDMPSPESVSVFKQGLAQRSIRVVGEQQQSVADVLVSLEGAVENRTEIPGVGMHGAVVGLHAEASWTTDDRLILDERSRANGAGITEAAALSQAYREAADTLFPRFIDQLAARWRDDAYDGRLITVSVSGNHSDIQRFTSRLRRIFGVKKASLKWFRDQQAEVLVRFAGTSSLLAELVNRTRFEGIDVLVTEIGPNILALAVADPDGE